MAEQKKDEKLNKTSAPPPVVREVEPLVVSEVEPEPEKINELEKLKAERDEYLNGWKRAKADLINYQKDEAKRFQEMARYGVDMVLADMIMILDSFDLAEKGTGPVRSSPPEGSSVPRLRAGETSNGMEGLAVIKNQLENVLKKRGLERMKVSVGDKFDPNQHESIGDVDPELVEGGGGVSGTIIEVAVAGYTLDGKVVRPAKVKLVK